MSLSDDEEQLPGPPYCNLCGCPITLKNVICQSCRIKINCSCYDTPGQCDGVEGHTCICDEHPNECKAPEHACVCTYVYYRRNNVYEDEDEDDYDCRARYHDEYIRSDSSHSSCYSDD